MDTLNALGLCALLLSPQQPAHRCAQPVAIARWQPLIEEASQRFAVPETWIAAVMARESAGFSTLNGAPIISRAGAMGLMQLMPATWSDMRLRYGLGNDPFDAHDNIIAGAAYLREMLDRFGYPGLFAAYNAGPGRYENFLKHQIPLPVETTAYLVKLAGGATPVVPQASPLFVPIGAASAGPASPSLFVLRRPD